MGIDSSFGSNVEQERNNLKNAGLAPVAPDYDETLTLLKEEVTNRGGQLDTWTGKMDSNVNRSNQFLEGVENDRNDLRDTAGNATGKADATYNRINRTANDLLNAPSAAMAALRQGLDRQQRQTLAMGASGRGNSAARMRAALNANADARAMTNQTAALATAEEQANRFETAGNLMGQAGNTAGNLLNTANTANTSAGNLGVDQATGFTNNANAFSGLATGAQQGAFEAADSLATATAGAAESDADVANKLTEQAVAREEADPGMQDIVGSEEYAMGKAQEWEAANPPPTNNILSGEHTAWRAERMRVYRKAQIEYNKNRGIV